MPKVLLSVLKSSCRGGYLRAGETFVVEDLCPPLCHELWNRAYPYVFALQNGGTLDRGETRACCFEVDCPDESRVRLRGELLEEKRFETEKTGIISEAEKAEKILKQKQEKIPETETRNKK